LTIGLEGAGSVILGIELEEGSLDISGGKYEEERSGILTIGLEGAGSVILGSGSEEEGSVILGIKL